MTTVSCNGLNELLVWKKKRKALPPLKQSGGEIWKGLQGNIKRQSQLEPNPQATRRTRPLMFAKCNLLKFILWGKNKWCSVNWSWHCGTHSSCNDDFKCTLNYLLGTVHLVSILYIKEIFQMISYVIWTEFNFRCCSYQALGWPEASSGGVRMFLYLRGFSSLTSTLWLVTLKSNWPYVWL